MSVARCEEATGATRRQRRGRAGARRGRAAALVRSPAVELKDVANLVLVIGACGVGAAQIVYSNDRLWAWSIGIGVGGLVLGGVLELVVLRRGRADDAAK